VGACGYVPSCQVINGAASQEPGGHGACPVPKSPRVARKGPQGTARWQNSVRFFIVGEDLV
jgi:hypothetical protein